MKNESESRSVVSDSLRPHGLYIPRNSPGQNPGVSSLSLLQGIFPTQGLNPGLPHYRRILYQLSQKSTGQVSLKKKKIREVRHSNLRILHLCCHADFHLVPGATLSSLNRRKNSELSLLVFFLYLLPERIFLHHPLHIVSPCSFHSHCSLLLKCFLFTCFSREAI